MTIAGALKARIVKSLKQLTKEIRKARNVDIAKFLKEAAGRIAAKGRDAGTGRHGRLAVRARRHTHYRAHRDARPRQPTAQLFAVARRHHPMTPAHRPGPCASRMVRGLCGTAASS